MTWHAQQALPTLRTAQQRTALMLRGAIVNRTKYIVFFNVYHRSYLVLTMVPRNSISVAWFCDHITFYLHIGLENRQRDTCWLCSQCRRVEITIYRGTQTPTCTFSCRSWTPGKRRTCSHGEHFTHSRANCSHSEVLKQSPLRDSPSG